MNIIYLAPDDYSDDNSIQTKPECPMPIPHRTTELLLRLGVCKKNKGKVKENRISGVVLGFLNIEGFGRLF
jgi:hypothetical protein